MFHTADVLDLLVIPIERINLLLRARPHLNKGVLVIAAAAGYGKTTLLHLLAREVPHSVWLPLTIADRDVVLLESRLMPHLDEAVILLDDVHVLEESPQALHGLSKAIKQRPQGWAISGRWIPAPLVHVLQTLPTLHITEQDLAFSLDEMEMWLQPLGYDKETIAAWHSRTGGWPLAVAVLARLSARHRAPSYIETNLEEFLETVVFAHLWQELSPPLRRFLTLTGVALMFSTALAQYLWTEHAPATYPPAQQVWQEVVQRRLFLEPGLYPGTWRYHDLFRSFLRRQAQDRSQVAHTIVQWYRQQGQYPEAIEQALADELWDEAANLLETLPDRIVHETNRIYTFRRWVQTLPPTVQDAHPTLLIRLGSDLCAFDQKSEGLSLIQRGVTLIQASADQETLCQTYQALAWGFLRLWDFENTHFYAQRLLQVATNELYQQHALLILGHMHARWGTLPQARTYYRKALALTSSKTPPLLETHIRDSLAASVLTSMGFFRQSWALLEQSRPVLRQWPAPYAAHLQQRATVHIALGQWEAARNDLEEMETYIQHGEAVEWLFNFWRHWAWAMYNVATEQWEKAQSHLTDLARSLSHYPYESTYFAVVQAWFARRQGRFEEAIRTAETALARSEFQSAGQAILALERDITLTLSQPNPPPLHSDTLALIKHRAVTYLLRLRGLLVWRCYQQGRTEQARRHLRRLAAIIRRFPDLESIVVERDPELNVQVWRVALLLGEAEELAVRAMGRLAPLDTLAEMLSSVEPEARCRAARALAATRREEAMPILQRALQREADHSVGECEQEALTFLESLPPPEIRVQFLGAFRVWRGEQEIPESAWPRPAVVRLFQYFVIHRGQAIPRDRLLEDLWPGQDPGQARTTLRRLLSWLRQVLEPYMPPKGPFRYLSTAWDVYTFDPHNQVRVDVETFEQEVQAVLAAGDTESVPPLPETFLATLQKWAPPVSAAMYEDWWIKRVEYWRELYVNSCVYVAQAYLMRRAFHLAIEWADKALKEAPWLESAYQVKMRALARQGYRAQALVVYEEAQTALQRELGVAPSPQTEWLVERLRRGEDI